MYSNIFFNFLNNPELLLIREHSSSHTPKVSIPKQFNYEKVQIDLGDKIIFTSKNIPILDVIFYIHEEYLFACKWKQSKDDNTGDVNVDVICYIDLNSKTIFFRNQYFNNATAWLKRYFFVIQEIFKTNQKELLEYLNNKNNVTKYFYYKLIYHFGHTVVDTLAGIDFSSNICNNKAIVCLPTPIFTEHQLNQIFDKPIYISHNKDQVNQIINEVYKQNCLLFNVVENVYTFNFIKKLKIPDNLAVSKKAILIVKYDYRFPINQLDVLKETISILAEYEVYNFVIVNYIKYYCGADTVKDLYANEHRNTILQLNNFFAKNNKIKIFDTYGDDIFTLSTKIQNSLCVVAPYGAQREVATMLSSSKLNMCYGNKKFFAKEFNTLDLSINCIENIIPLTEEQQRITKRPHENCYFLNLNQFKIRLNLLLNLYHNLP